MPIHPGHRKLKLLQHFGIGKPAADKAGPKWTCGRSTAGKACSLGPDRFGKCQTLFECRPSETRGTWRCGRSISEGGPCDNGPKSDGKCCRAVPPCAPVRSLRTVREAVAKWVAALVFSLLALAITYANSTMVLKPGPITSMHASIGECKSCHSNLKPGQFGWVHSVFAAADPRQDSEACLTCHKMTKSALNPHGLKGDALEVLTDRLRASNTTKLPSASHRIQNTLFPFQKAMSKGVFCATCHKEHKGGSFNIQDITDARCHTCHTSQFTEFDKDHPEFGSYPFRRRPGIFFDHVTHSNKHFPDTVKENDPSKPVPATCADCHQPGANKSRMSVKPFEQICSACHIGQIVGADRATGPKGVPVITLPGLDLETLKQNKIAIGQWPEASEAELTPFMKLLIGRDAPRRALLDKIGKLDLLDLSSASAEDLADVRRFAWEIKELIFAFATAKTADVMKRVGATTGGDIDPALIGKLTASLPRDVLSGATRDWLPKLQMELEQHKSGKAIKTTPSPDAEETATPASGIDAEAWAELGGWYRQDFAISYRPTGHKDVLFKAWLDFTGRLFTESPANLANPVFSLLTDKEAQGQCTKCHSIDAINGGGRKVQWKPMQSSVTTPQFTTFNHAPHFGVTGEKGCATCHTYNSQGDFAKSYQGTDPAAFVPNFTPVEKQQCTACHQRKKARQDCLLCHNYHVNGVVSPVSSTRLPK